MPKLIRKTADFIAHAILAAAAALAIGFFVYADAAAQGKPDDNGEAADGIVVLTGDGAGRVTEGFKLLQQGRAGRLLISGVNPQATDREFMLAQNAPPALFRCCTDIGREATDTIGNAKEAAQWAKEHDFNRIIVVTSDFHMARSLTELRMAMPKADFIPHSVRTLNSSDWWRNRRSLRRLGVEYVKVVAVNVRAFGDWLNPFNDGQE
jgi:uncharacterized SAM-binding protein YcdF (DUF218 family)